MKDVVASVTSRRAAEMALVGAFAIVGLLLGIVGVYGIATHSVEQRRHEFGVRLALGADPDLLRRMVASQGLRVMAIGTAIGLGATLAAGRLLRAFLFGVAADDPATFALAALIVTITALLGVWAPARRAASIDPVVSLRVE